MNVQVIHARTVEFVRTGFCLMLVNVGALDSTEHSVREVSMQLIEFALINVPCCKNW